MTKLIALMTELITLLGRHPRRRGVPSARRSACCRLLGGGRLGSGVHVA
jgi:hypothetical protein